MKVLFTFGGLPHYLIPLLNRINKSEGIEILVLIPEGESKTFGSGVKQDNKGIDFKVIYSKEFQTYYRKPFFKNFIRILKEEKPDIIVTSWPYTMGFVFYPLITFFIKKRKIKLVLKEIPFMVPKRQEALRS